MRIIKFRGKRIDNGEWVYGMPYSFKRLICDIPYYDRLSILMFNPEWDLEAQINYLRDPKNFAHLEDSVWKVIPESVGQYTGFRDEKHIEIYGKDIVKINNEKCWKVIFYASEAGFWIKYTYESGFWKMRSLADSINKKIEIVGNLIDNPELLESDTKK